MHLENVLPWKNIRAAKNRENSPGLFFGQGKHFQDCGNTSSLSAGKDRNLSKIVDNFCSSVTSILSLLCFLIVKEKALWCGQEVLIDSLSPRNLKTSILFDSFSLYMHFPFQIFALAPILSCTYFRFLFCLGCDCKACAKLLSERHGCSQVNKGYHPFSNPWKSD